MGHAIDPRPQGVPARRRRSPLLSVLPVLDKHCPRCRGRSVVIRTPPWLRAAQWVLLDHLTYRYCRECEWRGVSIHRERTRSLRGAERKKTALVSMAVVVRVVVAVLLFVLPIFIILYSRL